MMDPLDFIAFSEHLFENLESLPEKILEASMRSAISRIYYGILHFIQIQFKINVPESKTRYYHAYVISEMERIADDELLIDFNYLKNARTDSDYDLTESMHRKQLENVIKCKDRVLLLIREKPRISFDIDNEKRFFGTKKD